MTVVFSDRARDDLETIWQAIAHENPGRATSFVEELIDLAESLATMPFRFAEVRRYSASGIRRVPHSNYLIFYRVLADRIEIIHVLHAARDIDRMLFGEGE
ncbi:type II toxin-antitoxin system RelE/ParE family toxin [Rhizobium sp. SGZ-381]|uniref:type II toxin-antitoxin system RelE/ParE family toxin n=1 Tax=Rhizobium sp. SGZ-381 TaxID=3342800 RepID=UPI00366E29F3